VTDPYNMKPTKLIHPCEGCIAFEIHPLGIGFTYINLPVCLNSKEKDGDGVDLTFARCDQYEEKKE